MNGPNFLTAEDEVVNRFHCDDDDAAYRCVEQCRAQARGRGLSPLFYAAIETGCKVDSVQEEIGELNGVVSNLVDIPDSHTRRSRVTQGGILLTDSPRKAPSSHRLPCHIEMTLGGTG